MPRTDEATASSYREALAAWMKQAEHLGRVFLEDEPIKPDQIKGLLNRESRAFEKFQEARLRLLGLDMSLEEAPAVGSEDNPFR